VIAQVGNIQTARANGVHAAIRRVTHHLISDGHDVEVWHFTRKAGAVANRVESGIRVVDLPVMGPRGRLGSYAQIPTPATSRWLRSRARVVDVVHMHSVFQPDHVWVRRIGVPYVITPHGGYHCDSFAGLWGAAKQCALRLHERPLLEGAGRVQVLSAAEERSVGRLAPHSRPTVLQLPLDVPDAGRHPYREDGPVLFLGRLDIRQKGLDLLLDAVEEARPVLEGRGLQLVGPASEDSLRWLRRRIHQLAVADIVEIKPMVDDRDAVMDLIGGSSLFVHPSRWEGLPTAVLEAMAVGVPVLVSPQTNMGELVTEARCGVVMAEGSGQLARDLHDILDLSGPRRDAMGRRGRAAVTTAFAWDHLRPGYEELYASARRT
jgi:glycosyltransferase involved in cell wall biosynthesis